MIETNQTQRCEKCGTELEPQTRFCDTCGHPVATKAQPSQTSPPAPNKSSTVIEDIKLAMQSGDKEEAVRNLDRLLLSDDPLSVQFAYQSLKQLSRDDSRVVSEAAAQIVAAYEARIKGTGAPIPSGNVMSARSSKVWLWVGLAFALVIFCVIIIGGSVLIFGSQGGLKLPFNLSKGQSNPQVKPEPTLLILDDTNPSKIITTPQASNTLNTEGQLPQLTQPLTLKQSSNILITEGQLPNLALTANEIPSGWSIEKLEGTTNEEVIEFAGNTDEVRKLINDSGRRTSSNYKYKAPGDPCSIMNGPIEMTLFVTPFANTEGAKLYYQWDNPKFSGKRLGVGVGEQTVFYPKYENKHSNCDSKFTRYGLVFQRLNTETIIFFYVPNGAMSDDEAEKQVIMYAKIIDAKITANTQ